MLKPPTSVVGPYPHKAGRLVHHGTLEKKKTTTEALLAGLRAAGCGTSITLLVGGGEGFCWAKKRLNILGLTLW
jgi:hypothetical protein